MYFDTLDKTQCNGCSACVAICPKHCIQMRPDEEGFNYPIIDKGNCISCKLCEKVCPNEHPRYSNNTISDVYAAYLKDTSQRTKSTSGGIFYSISKWIINQGGIVYGAAFNDNFKLEHIGVDNLDDLAKLRGSKYLQSDIGNTYLEVKKNLDKNRWVYFTGCGCQVAGLYAFLRKNYECLVTSDLVCHGVPSQLMFDYHIDYLKQKEQCDIASYSFRDLEGWGVSEIYECVNNKKVVRRNKYYYMSPYLFAFMHSYNYRYSCYECKYAKLPRQGDITLADYWGVEKYFPDLDISKGVSLILVNSIQGQTIWNEIKDSMIYYTSDVRDASIYNPNLVTNTKMPAIRPRCYDIIKERGYSSVANNEFRIKYYWFYRFKSFCYYLYAKIKKIL